VESEIFVAGLRHVILNYFVMIYQYNIIIIHVYILRYVAF